MEKQQNSRGGLGQYSDQRRSRRVPMNTAAMSPSPLFCALFALMLVFMACGMAEGRDQNLETWTKGQKDLKSPATYRPLTQDNQGNDLNRQTMLLFSVNITNPDEYRVAIRQHNLIISTRYKLEARINCLKTLENEEPRATLLPVGGTKFRWYFNGTRIRRDLLDTYRFSLEGRNKSTLVLAELQENRTETEELNGVYECKSYSREGFHTVYKKYHIKIFDPGSGITAWDRAPKRVLIENGKSSPKFAKIDTPIEVGLTWAVFNFTLITKEHSYNSANVSTLQFSIFDTGLKNNKNYKCNYPDDVDTFKVFGLKPGTKYKYKVKSFSKKFNSEFSGDSGLFRTDLSPQDNCSGHHLTVKAGSTAAAICVIRAKPPAGAQLASIGKVGASVLVQTNDDNDHILTITWPNVNGKTSRRTCFSAANKYKEIDICVNMTILCSDLAAPMNGSIEVTYPNRLDSKAEYVCDNGYYLDGPTGRHCISKTALWSGKTPVCVAHSKPTASLGDENILFLNPSENIVISCNTTGYPPPEIRWQLDGQPLITSSFVTATFSASRDSVSLKLNAMKEKHILSCVAENLKGEADTSVTILEAGKSSPRSVYVNDNVTLTCLENYPDLPPVRWSVSTWNEMQQPNASAATLSVAATEISQHSDMTCSSLDGKQLETFTITVKPLVRFSSTTPALEEDEVVVFEYGQRASLSCSFESDFPDLSVQWTPSDVFSFPGVFSSAAGGSVDLTIVQFTQDHEVTIECVGSASGGTAQKLISLRGVKRGTCEVMESNVGCSQFLGGEFVYVPLLDQAGNKISETTVALIRRQLYQKARQVFHANEQRIESPCSRIAHRLICELLYSPCDPRAIQYANANKTWPRQVCRQDCITVQYDLCPSEWSRFSTPETRRAMNVLGLNLCEGLPSSDGGAEVECVRSLRFDESTVAKPIRDTCFCGNGKGYSGDESIAESSEPCTNWNSSSAQHPNYSLSTNSSKFWVSPVGNQCRNPAGRGSQPWCYTSKGWENCTVPRCQEDITNRCKKLNSSVCQDVKLIAGGLVDSIYPEIENLGNFTQFRSLVKNQEIGRTCLEHLQRILCVEAYPLCHRQAPDQCGDVRRVCKSYCENFKAVCPLPQKVRDIITEKWRDFDSLMDCDMFDHEPRDINDRCIHQPIILGDENPTVSGCSNGDDYRGDVSQTKSGRQCQPWGFTRPHLPAPHLKAYMDRGLKDNQCRNPGGLAPRPWCYTMDPDNRWEECDVEVKACQTMQEKSDTVVYLLVVIGVLVPFAAVVGWLVYRKRNHHQEPKTKLESGDFHRKKFQLDASKLPTQGTDAGSTWLFKDNPEYWLTSPDLLGITKLQHKQLEFTAQLAEGHFGMVWRGKATDLVDGEEKTTVAIKTLKADCSGQTERGFIMEAQVISRFKHVNIIRLLGVCIPNGSSGQPLCLLFEYMEYGDLLHFLREAQRRRRPTVDLKGRNLSIESAESLLREQLRLASTSTETSLFDKPLTQHDLCSMAAQIAHAMQFLSARQYVHRDLAARNCLVGRNHVVKLADFGLSRNVIGREYYKPQGNWAALPVRWMPPEVIMYNKHTTVSDVWSFGVLLWEVFTYGAVPYYDLSNEEVVKRVCEEERRLPQPHECPPVIYGLMQECWFEIAEERPTFRRLWKALHTWRPPLGVGTSDYASGGTDSDLENLSQPSDDVFEEMNQPTMVVSPHGTRVPKTELGRGSLTSPLLSQGPSTDSSELQTSGTSDSIVDMTTSPIPFMPEDVSHQPLQEVPQQQESTA